MNISELVISIEAGYRKYEEYFANRRFARIGDSLSWDGRKSQFFPARVEYADALAVEDNRQYSFQILGDGSFFQIWYQTKGEDVVGASLGFYSLRQFAAIDTGLVSRSLDPLLSEPDGASDSDWADAEADDSIRPPEDETNERESPCPPVPRDDDLIAWVRLDYAPSMARGYVHAPAHMHMAGFSEARLPVYSLPAPSQFIDFCMCLFYPVVFESLSTDGNGDLLPNAIMKPTLGHTWEPGSWIGTAPHLRFP